MSKVKPVAFGVKANATPVTDTGPVADKESEVLPPAAARATAKGRAKGASRRMSLPLLAVCGDQLDAAARALAFVETRDRKTSIMHFQSDTLSDTASSIRPSMHRLLDSGGLRSFAVRTLGTNSFKQRVGEDGRISTMDATQIGEIIDQIARPMQFTDPSEELALLCKILRFYLGVPFYGSSKEEDSAQH